MYEEEYENVIIVDYITDSLSPVLVALNIHVMITSNERRWKITYILKGAKISFLSMPSSWQQKFFFSLHILFNIHSRDGREEKLWIQSRCIVGLFANNKKLEEYFFEKKITYMNTRRKFNKKQTNGMSRIFFVARVNSLSHFSKLRREKCEKKLKPHENKERTESSDSNKSSQINLLHVIFTILLLLSISFTPLLVVVGWNWLDQDFAKKGLRFD